MRFYSFILFVIYFFSNGYIGTCFAQANIPSNAKFLIDTPSSVLKVYVGKAGVLSAMGHNHVITFYNIKGQIIAADERQEASALLVIDLRESIVDDAQERDRAGSGYDSMPGESAREATRNNMAGPIVLDLARYPLLEVSIKQTIENQYTDIYEVTLNFKGSKLDLTLPATVFISENKISVDSDFQLSHKQLNLRPFSTAGGLLRVAENIRFQIHLEAVRI
jgi:hypothetical protein